jgi:hypothetical protein
MFVLHMKHIMSPLRAQQLNAIYRNCEHYPSAWLMLSPFAGGTYWTSLRLQSRVPP